MWKVRALLTEDSPDLLFALELCGGLRRSHGTSKLYCREGEVEEEKGLRVGVAAATFAE